MIIEILGNFLPHPTKVCIFYQPSNVDTLKARVNSPIQPPENLKNPAGQPN